ncbi:hypothetical protein EVAR_101812_1 [Eumeta japonica]|uniref:Uncharacterized protein n=1 Tax=Eumeta variegata TaxID=151549 RepID=A0A4C1SNG3_EUMVA|nr:hypothetical protein EVAR_101812_1 [Eumeta japonica]
MDPQHYILTLSSEVHAVAEFYDPPTIESLAQRCQRIGTLSSRWVITALSAARALSSNYPGSYRAVGCVLVACVASLLCFFMNTVKLLG